jgi:uncharacterized membrane protein YfcA
MGIIKWSEERTKALTMWDIGILKLYCSLFGIIVGAYVSVFVQQRVVWFVAAVVILGGYLMYRWLTAKAPE